MSGQDDLGINQTAGAVPDATTSVAGKVKLAADGGTDAGTVVQADDSRVGTIRAARDSESILGPEPILRAIAGSNIALQLQRTGGELKLTISASTAGGFPGFGSGTPTADTSAGSEGSSGSAARFDHSHPLASDYLNRDGILANVNVAANATTISVDPSGTPRLAVFISKMEVDGWVHSGGFAVGDDTGDQVTVGYNFTQTGYVIGHSNCYAKITNWSASAVTATRESGSDTFWAVEAVISDKL
jgi:hypothetical protein